MSVGVSAERRNDSVGPPGLSPSSRQASVPGRVVHSHWSRSIQTLCSGWLRSYCCYASSVMPIRHTQSPLPFTMSVCHKRAGVVPCCQPETSCLLRTWAGPFWWQVQPSPENVVSTQLVGSWIPDSAMNSWLSPTISAELDIQEFKWGSIKRSESIKQTISCQVLQERERPLPRRSL